MGDVEGVTEPGRATGAAPGAEPLIALHELAARVLTRVAEVGPEALLATPFGVIAVREYLSTRVVELTVHTCDLAAALNVEVTVPADAAQTAFTALGSQPPRKGAASVLLALTGRRPLPTGVPRLRPIRRPGSPAGHQRDAHAGEGHATAHRVRRCGPGSGRPRPGRAIPAVE